MSSVLEFLYPKNVLKSVSEGSISDASLGPIPAKNVLIVVNCSILLFIVVHCCYIVVKMLCIVVSGCVLLCIVVYFNKTWPNLQKNFL